jgi:hypothetical protein
VQLGPLEDVPVDARDLRHPVGGSERHYGDPAPNLPLGANVKKIKPDYVKQEAGRKTKAIIGKARQDEPDHRNAVAGQCRRKDDRAAADAGVGLDRQPGPKSHDDRHRVAGERIEAGRLDHRSGQHSPSKPGQAGRDQQCAGKLEAFTDEIRRRHAHLIVSHR